MPFTLGDIQTIEQFELHQQEYEDFMRDMQKHKEYEVKCAKRERRKSWLHGLAFGL